MGNVQRTVQNLEVVSIDTENNVILIKGNVPGPKKSFVVIRESVKGLPKREAVKLVSYVTEEEPVVEDQVESTNEAVENTEVVEEQVVETPVEETKTEE